MPKLHATYIDKALSEGQDTVEVTDSEFLAIQQMDADDEALIMEEPEQHTDEAWDDYFDDYEEGL